MSATSCASMRGDISPESLMSFLTRSPDEPPRATRSAIAASCLTKRSSDRRNDLLVAEDRAVLLGDDPDEVSKHRNVVQGHVPRVTRSVFDVRDRLVEDVEDSLGVER